ncbi:MAG: ATP-binding protein [Thiomargarita sp.]|nr:ATP-binding protein [Thiomargarita sp.]
MRVLRLYIQECGVFEHTLIDFTHEGNAQDIVCLAGVNGTGKTTIIELIFNLIILLKPSISPQDISYDRLKPNVLTRVKFAQLDILFFDVIISLVVGDPNEIQKDESSNLKQAFIIEPELGTLIFQFENAVVKLPEGEKERIIIQHLKGLRDEDKFSKRDMKKDNISIFQKIIDDIEKYTTDPQSIKSINTELPFVYFFNAHDREIQDIRYASIPNEKPKYNLAHKYSPDDDDLNKMLVYYDYAYQEEFEELKNWVNKNILVGKSIEKIDRPNFKTLIKSDNGHYHGLDLLSSGEESLLIIAMQIYLKAHKNSVFIIDEIDQSLHPEFQQKVISLISKLQKEKDCQIIISSHSEIVWTYFGKKGLIDLTQMVL